MAQQQLGQLQILTPRVLHLHALIETFAVAKTNHMMHKRAINRVAAALKLSFMTAGLESLSQACGAIWLAAHRGGNQHNLARAFRENMASLRSQIEIQARTIVRNDEERRAKQARLKGAGNG